MIKRVNDIFYSLQGEGRHTGRAALFVRFSGCNLRCPFCDTKFDSFRELSDEDIIAELLTLCQTHDLQATLPMVVLTGGEPTLQVDEPFVNLLHQEGFYVAMESNGLLPAPANLNWLTVSPKAPYSPTSCLHKETAKAADEIKIVFDGKNDPERILADYLGAVPASHLYLQPCDTGNADENRLLTSCCVDYIKHHPHWQLSLQTHKLIGIE